MCERAACHADALLLQGAHNSLLTSLSFTKSMLIQSAWGMQLSHTCSAGDWTTTAKCRYTVTRMHWAGLRMNKGSEFESNVFSDSAIATAMHCCIVIE